MEQTEAQSPEPAEPNIRGHSPQDPHDHVPPADGPIAGRRDPAQLSEPGAGLFRLERQEQAALVSLRVAKHDRVGYQLAVLEYVATSLFESPAQTLVNTVNTVGVMGKGIANDFRRLYPDMFERYQAFCAGGKFAVGQLYLYRTPHKWVLNFPTKQHWRSPSRMEWIEAGLQKFLDTF